jgi:hypothetical protein
MGEYFNQPLENSKYTIHAHAPGDCIGERCPIHKRTDHHMRSWPQNWRGDRWMMERICEHSVGHPDPDDPRIYLGLDDGTHGCDGCCHE